MRCEWIDLRTDEPEPVITTNILTSNALKATIRDGKLMV